MRIWLINHYAVPPTQVGGTRHYTLARELIRRGHEVAIFASSFDHYTHAENSLRAGENFKYEVIEEVPFLWLRTPPYSGNTRARMWNMMAFASRVLSSAKAARLQKPDVIVGSSPHLFAALAAERLARRHRVPFVLEVRDLWPETLIDIGNISRRHPAIIMMEKIERHLYRRAKRIISLLPGAVEHIVQKGAAREKVVWIPNGVDLGNVPPPVPSNGNGKFTLMYAGTHGLCNGLDTVLDAAAILQSEGWEDRVLIRFVGDGPEKPRLRERAQQEQIRNVRFDDPVPKSQVPQVLQEADAFLMNLQDSPVFQQGVSPNKLFDYLAAGRPVLFSIRVSNNPVDEAKAGITVPPEDPQAMAQAMTQLASLSPTERWDMGLRGREYVEKNHDFQLLTERLERVLCEVVGARS